jgi:Ni,Fe-hydrogenase III small subunit
MKWWPLYGLKRKLTERKKYLPPVSVKPIHEKLFKRSLFIYIIDVGSSNAVNFEIAALEAPQYNTHRFGIYFTDSPRHADVLLVLGRPVPQMLAPLHETISQVPNPFGIVVIDDSPEYLPPADYSNLPNVMTVIRGIPSPSEILGLLLDLSKPKKEKA